MTLGSINCQNCSAQNLNQAKFCCKCGSPLQAANPTSPQMAQAHSQGFVQQPVQQQSFVPHQGGVAMQQAYAVQPQRSSTMMIISWICAGLGLVMLGPLSSIPGAIIAWMDISSAKSQGHMPPMGSNLALWANVIVTVIGMLMCVGSMMLMPLMMM